jgi:hypothetical protein
MYLEIECISVLIFKKLSISEQANIEFVCWYKLVVSPFDHNNGTYLVRYNLITQQHVT